MARLSWGLLPHQQSDWPDGLGTKDDARVVVSLVWTNGRWCLEADGATAVALEAEALEARAAGFGEAGPSPSFPL